MNIRETCLIHTELKSSQIDILEKMIDHFCFLDTIYGRSTLLVWGNAEEAVVITEKDEPQAVPGGKLATVIEGYEDHLEKVVIRLSKDGQTGLLLYDEKAAVKADSLTGVIQLYQSSADDCCPAGYLVPDGILVFDPQGQQKFSNDTARTMLRRMGLQRITQSDLADLLGLSAGQILDNCQPCILGDSYQVGPFEVCMIVVPVIIRGRYLGALIILSDLTLIKKKEKELIEKSTVIKEIHHRVKNNLQTISSLLRLQMRRTNLKVVEKVFTESINRVLSIALIHEALSKQELEVVNIKQTSYNILQMILSNMVDPSKKICGDIYGQDVYLSATLASSVSLCVTELIQNAVEHAFVNRDEGSIRIFVDQCDDQVTIKIEDNGVGISPGKLQNERSLGMQIVNTIIEHNLKGSFSIEGHRYGTVAIIKFNIWKEQKK